MQQLAPMKRQETLVSGEIKKLFMDFLQEEKVDEEPSEYNSTSRRDSIEELLSEYAPPRQIDTAGGDLWSETSLLAFDRPAPESLQQQQPAALTGREFRSELLRRS